MNRALIVPAIVVVILVGVGAYFFFSHSSTVKNPFTNQIVDNSIPPAGKYQTPTTTPTTNPVPPPAPASGPSIGTSAGGRAINAYHYGTGSTELLFIGGIHGGYEWNTSLVAYNLMDYLDAHPDVIPQNITVTVIPVLNPDGLAKVVGSDGRFTAGQIPASQDATVPGRFNAHNVDLNRNFDCDWQATGVWQNKSVSGGTAAFSEPESQAIKAYVEAHAPTAVVVWYSSAGGVFSSNCHSGVPAETQAITKIYADASKYPAYQSFDFYAITGDMVNWLAKNNIPAISVLLTNHTDVEWDKNWAGIQALLKHYTK